MGFNAVTITILLLQEWLLHGRWCDANMSGLMTGLV